jgi:YidC/Oxa1 family membrane protein insertase
MKQDTRILIAFALSFVMLLVYRVLFFKETPKPAPSPATQSAPAPTKPGQTAPAAGQAAEPAKAAKPAKPPAPVAIPAEEGTGAQDIVVESDLYRVTLSTEGAVVKSWVLKKYKDAKGKPLNVINSDACANLGYPMSVDLPNAQEAGLADQLNKAFYVVKESDSKSGESSKAAGQEFTAPVTLEFTYSDGKVRASKKYSFGTGYEVGSDISIFDGVRYLPVGARWPGGFGDQSVAYSQMLSYAQVAYAPTVDKIETLSATKVKEDRTIHGPFTFAGMEDRYFAAVFLPEKSGGEFAEPTDLRLKSQTWTPPDWKEKEPPKFVEAALVNPAPAAFKFRLFVTPKDTDVLRAESPQLEGLVDFGWFKIFAKPLFIAMLYIHQHWVHNYGWAIILLTIIINMLMFPLKLKQIRSAQEMQKVGPLIKSIQDRYKQYKFNDPRKQRMNQEVMKIYSDHGINPLSGCLPMALQLPFLYGFYRVLELPIELRHAPWIGWVTDLSQPETVHMFGYGVHILPILMVISSYFMQKMTPMPTVDPNQQRMMMMMPIIFGFMFYNLASGLVLYFMVASLVGIAQQVFINKTVVKPAPIQATGNRAAGAK